MTLSRSHYSADRTNLKLLSGALVLLIALLSSSGITRAVAQGNQVELFRPEFHFSPHENWMNDPNGPVYYKGEYHLFFQYNPFGDEWGNMSWGHAVSTDLVRWKQLPVAIPEAKGVMIFSGSVVVDAQNTSGFCESTVGGDRSCLVAIYTGYNGMVQNQNIAYSNDRGRTWIKYPQNPVIDLKLQNFRDPKVFWYAPDRKWIMVTALSALHQARLFRSADLKHWSFLSDFGPAGAIAGVWECPDLFQLPIDNEPGQSRWVLSVNINPGGVAGGSGDQYFVGQFDGKRFIEENSTDTVLWADYGKDFYASTSFSNVPVSDGRRIWIGWLDNWQYAARLPTSPWRGIQTIPRVLKLENLTNGIRLLQEPVEEIRSFRTQHTAMKNVNVTVANRLLRSKGLGRTFEIEARIAPGNSQSFGFEIRKGASERTVVGIDSRKAELFVDRTYSGITNFDPAFPGRQTARLNSSGKNVMRLRILVDACSVEVFANQGETVISDLIFPSSESEGLQLFSTQGEINVLTLDVWTLKFETPRAGWERSGRLSGLFDPLSLIHRGAE